MAKRKDKHTATPSLLDRKDAPTPNAPPPPPTRIFICSAYGSDNPGTVSINRNRAIDYCKEVIHAGHIPFAPHLLYPQMLNDRSESERATGMRMGLEWLRLCDEMRVYVWDEYISLGMAAEIKYATAHNISTRYYHYDTPENASVTRNNPPVPHVT